MPAGLPVAVMLLAQAAGAAPSYGPAAPPAPKTAAIAGKASEPCKPANPEPGSREIVICAEKPQGYRINPDVLKAKKEVRSAGRPTRPGPISMKDNSCKVVGPAPCIGVMPGINLLAAAATAAEMSRRLAKGQEIGSMFVTDPHPSEYQLYLEAKREREAKEAAAKAKAAAAKAKAAPVTGTTGQAEPPHLETAPAH